MKHLNEFVVEAVGTGTGPYGRSYAMSTALSPLLAPMLSSAAMRAVCDDAAFLQNMLDFEAALARAEAATGVIPAAAGSMIASACRAESFDLPCSRMPRPVRAIWLFPW
jgi:hypothetical protein